MFGNKTDLVNDRKISKEEVLKFCKEFSNMKYIETSAADNIGVEEGFTELIWAGLKQEWSKVRIAPAKSSGTTWLNW